MADATMKLTLKCDADEFLITLIETQIKVARIAVGNAQVQLAAEELKLHNLEQELNKTKLKQRSN